MKRVINVSIGTIFTVMGILIILDLALVLLGKHDPFMIYDNMPIWDWQQSKIFHYHISGITNAFMGVFGSLTIMLGIIMLRNK